MSTRRPFQDKMLSRAPAGYWLTQDVKATPQRFVAVEDALQSIIDGLKIPKNRNRMKAYIYSGIPITTLTETLVRMGYSENEFNPDIAELLKPALNLYLVDLAVENDFNGPFRLTPEPLYQDEIDDIKLEDTMMRLMKENNPKLARFMEMKQDEDDKEKLAVREKEIMERQEKMKERTLTEETVKPSTGGFIDRDKESK